MAKTPKSRYADPKKTGTTIDIDPKDVKRVEPVKTVPSEQAISDITAPASLSPDKQAAADIEAKPTATKPNPAKQAPDKPASSSSASTSSASAKDTKPSASPAASAATSFSATPSAFATTASTRPVATRAEAGRGGSALIGGIVSGLIVLALGAGLQAAGVWPGARSGNDESVAALQAEIETLRGEIAASGSSDQVSALSAQIEELRGASGDTSATDTRLAALEEAIASVNNAPDAEAALQEVEQQLASAGETSTENASRLDAIDQSLQGLETRLAELEDSGGTERVIAASALKSAIDRGQPFMTELETYAKLDPEAVEVGELRDFAADGVATRATIAQGADGAARAMIAASSSVDETAGIVDRLTASARSLVQVRPVGMAEGDDVASIVARIEASVRADDYERAIAEYDILPPQVQEAGAEFMGTVRARHAADQLIDRALTGALQDA